MAADLELTPVDYNRQAADGKIIVVMLWHPELERHVSIFPTPWSVNETLARIDSPDGWPWFLSSAMEVPNWIWPTIGDILEPHRSISIYPEPKTEMPLYEAGVQGIFVDFVNKAHSKLTASGLASEIEQLQHKRNVKSVQRSETQKASRSGWNILRPGDRNQQK